MLSTVNAVSFWNNVLIHTQGQVSVPALSVQRLSTNSLKQGYQVTLRGHLSVGALEADISICFMDVNYPN